MLRAREEALAAYSEKVRALQRENAQLREQLAQLPGAEELEQLRQELARERERSHQAEQELELLQRHLLRLLETYTAPAMDRLEEVALRIERLQEMLQAQHELMSRRLQQVPLLPEALQHEIAQRIRDLLRRVEQLLEGAAQHEEKA
jgi:chromosome segregation ATPase